MHREAFYVIIMGAVSIVLFELLLFSQGFIAQYIELQIITAFEIVLLIIHFYHLIFLMYRHEVRSLHQLIKPPHCGKGTLYFTIITILDTMVAVYSLHLLISQKKKKNEYNTDMSIFSLPYGIIVLINLLMGMFITGLLLFMSTHYLFYCLKKCKPNLQYRKVRVLSVLLMMVVDVVVLTRFFSQRHYILNNFKVLGGEVAKNGFLNFFVMFWSIILYLRRPGYEVFLSFCFFICLAIYTSDFFYLVRNFFYELEENRTTMFMDKYVNFTKYFLAFIFMATVVVVEEFMSLIKNASLLNHLPEAESKRLYKIKARYVEAMILTWPEVIGYINMYLTAQRLYAFLLMLAALLVTQIVKHFMIRRNMGSRIQFNFPHNEYNSKVSAIGILINMVTQTVFIVVGIMLIQISFTNTSLYKLNLAMSVLLLVLAVFFQFIAYRRTHLHILILVGMDRTPIPAAIHPNSGIPEQRFEELVEVTQAHPDDDVCNICLDDMMVESSSPGRAENPRVVVRIKACLHKFHKPCLQQWSTRKSTCPKCRIAMSSPPALPAPREEADDNQTHANSEIVMMPQNTS